MHTEINVGSIIRVPFSGRFRVYQVTGIHHGAVMMEDIVSLRTLDLEDGSAFGQTVTELMVPLCLLATHHACQNA
jgi:hypothetical protein